MNDFDAAIAPNFPQGLTSTAISTIQINIGLTCNLACRHCHVESSPKRKEQMDWPTLQAVLQAAQSLGVQTIDITGGAPEMNPHFCEFLTAATTQGLDVMVRSNLTIHLEPGYETYAELMRDNKIQIVASLPCYLEKNVDKQRGKGVYHDSIKVIRQLNTLGYGIDNDLPLTLVYNPIGPVLPPDQEGLEADYHRELKNLFDISFTNLYTITNMPIGRFQRDLKHHHQDKEYRQLLRDAYNPDTLDGLMCRHQINVGHDGTLYDCDFNLALNMPINHGVKANIKDFSQPDLLNRQIMTASHCFGCTAGPGSSCGGALS